MDANTLDSVSPHSIYTLISPTSHCSTYAVPTTHHNTMDQSVIHDISLPPQSSNDTDAKSKVDLQSDKSHSIHTKSKKSRKAERHADNATVSEAAGKWRSPFTQEQNTWIADGYADFETCEDEGDFCEMKWQEFIKVFGWDDRFFLESATSYADWRIVSLNKITMMLLI